MSSPIDVITATLPAGYDPSQATVNASGSGQATELLDSQAFLQLLVAQLKYQDPTDPVDTANFMNQTAMLTQVQTMNTMSATLTEMVTAQQSASATSMIGKVIAFVDPAGNQVEGVVDAVSLQKGNAMLLVGDYAVPLAGVLGVANPYPDGSADDAVGSVDGDTSAGDSSGVGLPDDGTDQPTDSTDAPDPADSPTASTGN